MSNAETSGGHVVQIGDIAGVGVQISTALRRHTNWSVTNLPVPELGARRGHIAGAAAMPVRMIDLLTRISNNVRAAAANVAHLHWARYAPLVLSGSTPMIVHAHGTDVRGWNKGIGPRLVRRALEQSAAVVVSTPDLLDDVPDGAFYLPNPIDCEFWSSDNETTDTVSAPTILIHAKLDPIKGAESLISVAQKILDVRPDVTVLAFGGAGFDETARSAGIKILPHGTPSEVRSALLRSDIVIGQHRLRTVGLSELEAMACSRPVLMPLDDSSDHARLPVVSTSGTGGTVDACLALLSEPGERSALGRRGREYVLDRHDLPVFAASLTAVYDQVL